MPVMIQRNPKHKPAIRTHKPAPTAGAFPRLLHPHTLPLRARRAQAKTSWLSATPIQIVGDSNNQDSTCTARKGVAACSDSIDSGLSLGQEEAGGPVTLGSYELPDMTLGSYELPDTSSLTRAP